MSPLTRCADVITVDDTTTLSVSRPLTDNPVSPLTPHDPLIYFRVHWRPSQKLLKATMVVWLWMGECVWLLRAGKLVTVYRLKHLISTSLLTQVGALHTRDQPPLSLSLLSPSCLLPWHPCLPAQSQQQGRPSSPCLHTPGGSRSIIAVWTWACIDCGADLGGELLVWDSGDAEGVCTCLPTVCATGTELWTLRFGILSGEFGLLSLPHKFKTIHCSRVPPVHTNSRLLVVFREDSSPH